jgi:hypothetical protein
MPFCHFTQIQKVSTSPVSIKYKFSIQISKGIKNAIDLDEKNGNQLWKGEYIPTGYQKIPYHMAFDTKYDLRHKKRLVAGGNWNVKNKDYI